MAITMERDIKITLIIHILKNNHYVGDLDTFVTGICDGLIEIAPKSDLEGDFWSQSEYIDIHPEKFASIRDSSDVISIQAEKVTVESKQQWYEVTVEGKNKK